MLLLTHIHHIAVICSDYQQSKKFYTEILGLTIKQEVFRSERNSYKLDLEVNGEYQIELFSFPVSPLRPSHPEACGLRHLAFAVTNIEQAIAFLKDKNIAIEEIRIDEYTQKRFTFFTDPDNLPIELYEEG